MQFPAVGFGSLRRVGDGRCLAWSLPALLFIWLAAVGRGQDSYEIQVYGSETVPPGDTMVELHSNYTIDGVRGIRNGVFPNHHAFHETLELTHGFNSWFELGVYAFTSVQPGEGWEWVGNHVRPRARIPEEWHWPVGLSLSAEAGYVRRSFAEDTWSAELRPILDKQLGRFYFALNPTFEHSLHGRNDGRGFEFSPSGKASFQVTKKVAAGVEYYSGLGPVARLESFSNQEHQIMPVIDLDLAPEWEVNFGVGVGLNHSTDHLLLKLILGRRF